MKTASNFLLGLLMLLPLTSFANLITSTGSISHYGAGSVSYTLFDQDARARTRISVNSASFDTQIFLFENDGILNGSDFVSHNDDGGPGLNSLIDRILNAGSYILAVSDFPLSFSEAISGFNYNNRYGSYNLRINSAANVGFSSDVSSVPEPTTLSLLGLGLLGVRLSQRFRSR
ncbi:MAG: DVUA0089 family protein [Candidatus Thiodiazotropha sp. DIVDIV]